MSRARLRRFARLVSASSPANAATPALSPSCETAGGGDTVSGTTGPSPLRPPSLSDSTLSAAVIDSPTALSWVFPFSSLRPPPEATPGVTVAGSPVAIPSAVAAITPALFACVTASVAVDAVSPEAFLSAVAVPSLESSRGLELPLLTPVGSALHHTELFLARAPVPAGFLTRSAAGVSFSESSVLGVARSDPLGALS